MVPAKSADSGLSLDDEDGTSQTISWAEENFEKFILQ